MVYNKRGLYFNKRFNIQGFTIRLVSRGRTLWKHKDIKWCEPINIGCTIYVEELQEMAIRNCANRG